METETDFGARFDTTGPGRPSRQGLNFVRSDAGMTSPIRSDQTALEAE